MDLFLKIKELGDFNGIDFIGVAGIARHRKEINEIGGVLADGFPRALSVGIRLQDSIVNLLGDRNTYENVLEYETHAYRVVNERLDLFASLVSSVIQRSGFRALPLPSAERIDSERVCASISHKLIARLAGFGWIGKNCLLVTPEYGPRVRWTTVLTDAPFVENKTFIENRCGGCDVCVKACPAQAFTGRSFVIDEPRESRMDVGKCEEYLRGQREAAGLPVCGMCLYLCPYGNKSGGAYVTLFQTSPTQLSFYEKYLHINREAEMTSLRDLIPKDKFDKSTIYGLCQLSDNDIQPIIIDLLEWLQDYNWPVAKDILPIIMLHQNVAMPHILDILHGDDVMWIYWIIELVLPCLIYTNKQLIKSEIERLSSLEIINEDIEQIVMLSKNYLSVYYT